MTPDTVSLADAAQTLDVHYMTAYRYVRLGVLSAHKEGRTWRVARRDLEAFRSRDRLGGADRVDWATRLERRLRAGDERGSWQVVQAAMTAGRTPESIYLDVIAPALRAIGEGWGGGRVSISEEHAASSIVTRIIGRLSDRMRAAGRPRGVVIVGGPPGERHLIPVLMVADFLRAGGYEVIDIGTDLPYESFTDRVDATEGLRLVAVSVTDPGRRSAAKSLISAIRGCTVAPIIVGGGAVEDAGDAESLGADGWAPDARAAVSTVDAMTA